MSSCQWFMLGVGYTPSCAQFCDGRVAAPLCDADRRYDISLREERWLALERLRRICLAGLVSVQDFRCCTWFRARLGPMLHPKFVETTASLVAGAAQGQPAAHICST